MDFEIFRVLLALLGSVILAYQDGKTSFMDEKTLYAMLGAGVLFTFLSFDVNFIMWTLLGIGLIFGIGYFAYRAGQFGMGDVLLFASLHALLPVFPIQAMSQITNALGSSIDFTSGLLFPPIFNVLLVASVLGLIGSSVLYAYKLLKLKKLAKLKMKTSWQLKNSTKN